MVERIESDAKSAWPWLLAIVTLAAVLRVALYTGFFGSDEVTYVESAFKLLHGDWSVDSYVGANRYGVNLPVAAFGALFGQNEWAAAAYSLLCSIAEVALVTWLGMRMFGIRTGTIAGLVMASLPIHVHFAGRLSGDPPLSLAITASFVLFYHAERCNSRAWYFAAGCAAGLSFWVKPVVVFYLLVFAAYPLLFRRFNRNWVWMALGFAALVLANCGLFMWLSGDPWYLFRAVAERRASGYLEEGAAAGAIADAPYFYLTYLFGKIYHTGVLGYLALGGILLGFFASRDDQGQRDFAYGYTVWWALGLLAVLSLLVVAVNPLMLVPKQANYMLIFVAPLCLLAGLALARLRGVPFAVGITATVALALLLGTLEQASIQAFTSNSKAAVRFAREQPAAEVYGSTNAFRAASFDSLVRPGAAPAPIRSMQDLVPPRSGAPAGAAAQVQRFAIVDLETVDWSAKEPIRRLADVPTCWVKTGTLAPEGLGFGAQALRAVGTATGALPARLERIARPAPAVVYRVPASPCEDGSNLRPSDGRKN